MTLLFILIATLLFVRPVFDPDIWWHLGVGKHIWITKSIPYTDLFSFTAPDYPYIYHSWLSEVLLYLSYQFHQLWGVTILYSLAGALGLYFIKKTIQQQKNENSKIRKFENSTYYLLLITPVILSYTNLRVQIFTFLLLTIIYYLLTKFTLTIKQSNHETMKLHVHITTFLFLPFIFLIWANLHAGFILGLIFLTLFSIFHIFEIAKNQKIKPVLASYFLLLTSSFLTPLINPYGIRVYQQAIAMGTNQYAAQVNTDWFPLSQISSSSLSSSIVYGFLLISTILVLLIKNRISLQNKLLIITFTLLSFLNSRRFAVAAIVPLVPALYIFISEYGPKIFKPVQKFRTLKITTLCIPVIGISLLSLNWISQTATAYQGLRNYAQTINSQNQTLQYPYQALQYMKNNPLPQPILNDFNWGGYLAWNIPEQKIFIDGRMDNFIVNGQSFAAQYLKLVRLQPGWQEILERYNIQSVIIPPHYPLAQVLILQSDWQIIYQDDIATIFTKTIKQ